MLITPFWCGPTPTILRITKENGGLSRTFRLEQVSGLGAIEVPGPWTQRIGGAMKPGIPRAMDDLTPAWLSSVLGSEVAGFGTAYLDGGVMSHAYKLTSITYRDAPADAPRSVVVKIASRVPELRAFGINSGLYNRELNFYRQLSRDLPIAVPRLYGCDADGSAGSEFFYILMEDLTAHSKVFDQVKDPPDAAFARKHALDSARMHAKFWDADVLRQPWLGPTDGRYMFSGDSLCRVTHTLWPTFRSLYERVYGHGFFSTDDFVALETMTNQLSGPKSAAIYKRMIDILSSRPKTLVHGDMRADNVFRTDPALGKSVEESMLTYVDWQLVHAGPAGMEFGQAWFSSLDPEVRRNDLAFLGEYHELLMMLNPATAAYTYEMLLEDYRIGCCIWYMLLISLATGAFPNFHKPQEARAKALWGRAFYRIRYAMRDLECPSLVARLATEAGRD